MSEQTWWVFLLASAMISISPGAGAVAAMSAGLRCGFARGYWTTLGLQLALLLQIAVVAAGVGAMLAASAWALGVIKWLGVLYLLYLGVQQFRAPAHGVVVDAQAPMRRRQLLLRGFLVNASNPKSLVFIMAVLPQFLDATQPLAPQYLTMAVTMVGVDLLVMAVYTGLAARVLRLWRQPQHQRLMNRVFGGFFVLAASVLAMFRHTAR